MRNLLVVAAFCQCLFMPRNSFGEVTTGDNDTTIRILLGADIQDVSVTQILQQTLFLEQTWANTGMSTSGTSKS